MEDWLLPKLQNNKIPHISDFDSKLKNIINKVTLNKTRQVQHEIILSDHTTSYTKLINDVTKEVGLIPTKRLTKNIVINGYNIIN